MTDAEFESWVTCCDPKEQLPGICVGFFVPGQPVAKGRPRLTTRGGHARAFTPEKTVAYESLVAQTCHNAMKGMEAFNGPVSVDMAVMVSVPRSASKKRKEAALNGSVAPTRKPDLDNIIKAICDGMNGVAYKDDSQIVRFNVRKTFSETPGVHVMVYTLPMEAA
jgi:Holliday junction resolvase RusA-like endonuclease